MSLNKKNLSPVVKLTVDGDDIPCDENFENEIHNLSAVVDKNNGDIYLNFSSRVAMYDFARSLLHEALFNTGDTTELYPLGFEGKLQVVNGVRLTIDSSRIFVNYPSSASTDEAVHNSVSG
ncbi:hypothetical protein ACE02D_04970 [Shewanella bicestrii]|nr:Uncharacterised protein [Shewanella putrefaciens]